MHFKLPFDSSKPVVGEASVEIDKPVDQVFNFVGERFFTNYPKWAVEVVKFEPLDGTKVFVGAKAKQVRRDNDTEIESTFTITDFEPHNKLILSGLDQPYKHSYILNTLEQKKPTRLTFRFELLELEVFMRPFEKLIRYAIEDGAENTVENIKNLISAECN
ncbi:SRPBCC family protein [Methylomonas sp. SURF-2]|uniref:SRPBCC family protein n=1 Tax=Methylomonas subterranea TaxID=2952225 RepID=A0ABT1TD37_9GAMM|nr:SRPBCC family protein [Methylomonas sp. SURF-2]MCQ8102694.1 SRPBCC family protein [Methylomonas sp. SURF-2]